MNFQELLKDKKVLYTAIGVIVAVVLALIITVGVSAGSSKKGAGEPNIVKEKVEEKPLVLFKTDNMGKAIEVQALLAREGIRATTAEDGSKISIVLEKGTYTMSKRDRAILAIVKSGLVDEHIGLEIFDKGDFTSTKEDKKIRLIRAINGELSRLVRKIPPIENAQVFVSIPEQSMFQSRQKPITATVQLIIPMGERLDNLKIKAITNLLLGAVNDLKVENISITDTNGNVYSSIIDAENDMLGKIQENDKYMQNKVSAQLDKILGKGNYVATVSTFLTQAPVEKSSIIYDPDSKIAISEQGFSEKLGDSASDNSQGTPVSTYLPYGAGSAGGSASYQDRNYTRNANEVQYGVSKTHVSEYRKAGVIEEISIAVSIEESAMPATVSISELKELIAHAASPVVSPDSVSIAFINSESDILASEKLNQLPHPEESGNPWWVVGVLLLVGLGFGLKHISAKVRDEAIKQQEDVMMLKEKAMMQDKQLQDVNIKATELIQRQAQMAQNLLEQEHMHNLQIQQLQHEASMAQARANNAPPSQQETGNLIETLNELSMDFNEVDESEAVDKLKNWIDN